MVAIADHLICPEGLHKGEIGGTCGGYNEHSQAASILNCEGPYSS